MLSIIVAIDLNNAIGNKNGLLWHISQDLKYFKSVTTSHPVIMGRNTYYSIGRPLPGRRNIVVSGKGLSEEETERALSAIKSGSNTSFEQCRDLESLVKTAKESEEEFFVIGGRAALQYSFQVCRQTLYNPDSCSCSGGRYLFPGNRLQAMEEGFGQRQDS